MRLVKFNLLPIESLQRGKYQPRRAFDQALLQELAQSIQTQGLIEPLIVRELEPTGYEIIAGERRWRASMLIGLRELPCLIGNYTDEQAAAVCLIENIQRQDLNLIEEASAYQRLLQEFHFTQEEVATLVGKSRSHIANILRLLTLCSFVQKKICNHQLSLGHARVLVGLTDEQQKQLALRTEENSWSVRKLEEEVRALKVKVEESSITDPHIQHLQTKLAEQVGAPVQISTENGQGGWLKIKFFDNDTLAGLLDRMGLRYD